MTPQLYDYVLARTSESPVLAELRSETCDKVPSGERETGRDGETRAALGKKLRFSTITQLTQQRTMCLILLCFFP